MAAADGYKMEKPKGGKCGLLRARAVQPFGLLVDAPDDAELEDMSVSKTDQTTALRTKDTHWDMRFNTPTKRDLDFAQTKSWLEANAKKGKRKLVWKTAEKTSDGYRLLYTDTSPDTGTDYFVVYLRTVGKQKIVCSNSSPWDEGFDCIPAACESLRAP
ncbi:MAG TPA: hypothetical protein VGC41_18855 [Kofleriaceae bacterium]